MLQVFLCFSYKAIYLSEKKLNTHTCCPCKTKICLFACRRIQFYTLICSSKKHPCLYMVQLTESEQCCVLGIRSVTPHCCVVRLCRLSAEWIQCLQRGIKHVPKEPPTNKSQVDSPIVSTLQDLLFEEY